MFSKLAALGLAALACCSAAAQTTLHYKEGQRVDPRTVARILDTTPAGKTRSIRLLDQPLGTEQAAANTSQPNALSIPVRFDFNSAEIVPATRPQLDALAQGIKMLPPTQTVLIKGHTDAAGPDAYNQALSQRRALVVKQYLVRVHGISAARLKESGLGEAQPIPGTDPNAGENRRVEFSGG